MYSGFTLSSTAGMCSVGSRRFSTRTLKGRYGVRERERKRGQEKTEKRGGIEEGNVVRVCWGGCVCGGGGGGRERERERKQV